MSSQKGANAYMAGFGVWRLFHEKMNERDANNPVSFLIMFSQVQPYIDELDLGKKVSDFFSASKEKVQNGFFAFERGLHSTIVAKHGIDVGLYFELGFGLQNSLMGFAMNAFSGMHKLAKDGPGVDGFLAAFAEPWESIPNKPQNLIKEFQSIRHLLISKLEESEDNVALRPDIINKERLDKFAQAVHLFARGVDESHQESRISILFLAADPTDASRLRLGEEFREIQERLKLSQLREGFKLELPQLSIRPADISQALLDTQPQIVHFSGHGTSTGALCFENQTGQIQLVQPEALAALFEQFVHQVNCVLLNACYSETQAKAIGEHIKYVIGMNQAIGDKAAIAFAIGFYQALGAGRTIDEAYKLGCVQIILQGIPEHLTPVLIKNRQTQP